MQNLRQGTRRRQPMTDAGWRLPCGSVGVSRRRGDFEPGVPLARLSSGRATPQSNRVDRSVSRSAALALGHANRHARGIDIVDVQVQDLVQAGPAAYVVMSMMRWRGFVAWLSSRWTSSRLKTTGSLPDCRSDGIVNVVYAPADRQT